MLALPVAAGANAAPEPTPTPRPPSNELNLLLVDVALDGNQLTEVLNVYEYGNDILVPVGELARLLTIGVTVDPVTHVASGFILKEDHAFRLDPTSTEVTLPDGKEPFDPRAVRWIDGDLYVTSQVLRRWWPVDFELDMAMLSLKVTPREKLPVQLRMEREKTAATIRAAGVSYEDPGYPRLSSDYKLLSVPFIDNTLGMSVVKSGHTITTDLAYSGYATGDLLGMGAEAYLSVSKANPTADFRLTLARNNPDGGLLGPLDAKSVSLGYVGLPSLQNVLRGGGVGNGLLLSNRPLDQPTSYGLKTLRGELPPGWDVTLYFNDALIAFAQSRSDGLYEFEDQPLVFGSNEFRLVFHGPLGQARVERYGYQFDQSLTKPGRIYYTLGGQRANSGSIKQTVQVDLGLFKNVAATVGEVYIDNHDGTRAQMYINAGLRIASLGSLINIDHTHDVRGGDLTEVGFRTRLLGVSLDANHIWLDGFQSNFYLANADPIKSHGRLRITGALRLSGQVKLPFAVDFARDLTVSGREALNVNQRLSLNVRGTSFTNSINWNRASGIDSVRGSLEFNRWMAGLGLSAQAAYTIAPSSKLSSLAITADKTLGENSRLRLGLLHDFITDQDIATVGLNLNLGKFGIGFSGLYGGPQNMGLGLQVFTALSQNPRSGYIMQDWRPTAGMGLVSAHVFVDSNQNSVYDEGEENVENAGFTVNGGTRQQVKTDAEGIALLNRLQTKAYADIALDQGTLEDAQWQPEKPGVRILPRPGKVRVVDFPVVLTAEIDGIVYLSEQGKKRGIGNAQLELVDAADKVVGTTRSAGDGYYTMPNIKPGKYSLRIAPEQMKGLKLIADREPDVTINGKADFVNGVDFTMQAQRPESASVPSEPALDRSSIAASLPSRGAWRIQLGAFSKIEAARKFWKELSGHFTQLSSLEPLYINVNQFVRLQAQSISSLEASRRLCAVISLKAKGCFAVPPE